MDRLVDTWDWLRHSPLLFLLVTLVGYQLGRWLRERTGHPLAQPSLVGIIVAGSCISVLGVDYADYRDGTELIAFWLGPATVALAVPLHRQAHLLRGYAVPLAVGLAAGAAVSVASGVLLVDLLGGSDALARSMAPKASTTPVSIALAEKVEGVPSLAAVLTIAAGIIGAVLGPWVLDRLRVRDRRARGLALGAVSHGIGTSRALHEDEVEGAFAGLSMGVTALVISLLTPVFVALLR